MVNVKRHFVDGNNIYLIIIQSNNTFRVHEGSEKFSTVDFLP